MLLILSSILGSVILVSADFCFAEQNEDCKQAIQLIEKDIAKSYSLCPSSEQIVYNYVDYLINKSAFNKADKVLNASNCLLYTSDAADE